MNLISTLWDSVTTTILIVGVIVAISIIYNIWKHEQNKDKPKVDKSTNKE